MDDVADDLNSLASVGIDNGSDFCFGLDYVADVEGGGTVEHAEIIKRWTKLREPPSIDCGKIAFMIA